MKSATAALLLALAAACSPADSIPAAQAQQQPSIGTVAYPEIAGDAGDGQVYEYH